MAVPTLPTNRNQDVWVTGSITGPAKHAANVTPSDAADLTATSRGLYVGGAGDVKVTTEGGETAIFYSVPAGTQLAVQATRVWETGTTATNITAMW